MATGVQGAWSKTAASNGSADTNINFAEGQAPSTLNDSARALMAAVRKYYEDTRGGIATGGTSTAYTVTTNEGWTAYADGMIVAARMTVASGATPTLNVDSLGAKSIKLSPGATGVVPPAGALRAGSVYSFVYDLTNDCFVVLGSLSVTSKDVGDVFDTARSTAPAGSVLCYGQAISRTTYPDLFAAIGTQFGSGDGSTTFNVPDLRGRTVAGKDNMGGSAASRLAGIIVGTTLGATAGAETIALTTSEMPVHTHGITVDGNTVTTRITVNFISLNGTTATNVITTLAGSTTNFDLTSNSHSHTATAGNNGAGGAHSNLQPTMILNKCIFHGVF